MMGVRSTEAAQGCVDGNLNWSCQNVGRCGSRYTICRNIIKDQNDVIRRHGDWRINSRYGCQLNCVNGVVGQRGDFDIAIPRIDSRSWINGISQVSGSINGIGGVNRISSFGQSIWNDNRRTIKRNDCGINCLIFKAQKNIHSINGIRVFDGPIQNIDSVDCGVGVVVSSTGGCCQIKCGTFRATWETIEFHVMGYTSFIGSRLLFC
jgi:hypothetical protein